MQREQPIPNPTPVFSPIVRRPEREHNPSATSLLFHNLIQRPGTGKIDKDHQDKTL